MHGYDAYRGPAYNTFRTLRSSSGGFLSGINFSRHLVFLYPSQGIHKPVSVARDAAIPATNDYCRLNSIGFTNRRIRDSLLISHKNKPVPFSAFPLAFPLHPAELLWKFLAGGSLPAGIGFTTALFIGSLSLDTELFSAAKLGILSASIFSAAAGVALLGLPLRIRKQ